MTDSSRTSSVLTRLMPPLYGRFARGVQCPAHPGISRSVLDSTAAPLPDSWSWASGWLPGIVAVSLAVALFAARLVAPGPADFYIEPATGMVLIAIRPGSFMMGSPESEPGRNDDEVLHRVNVSRLFYIGKHEVTQAEWTKVMGSNPSHFGNCERCPVESVDFYQVNTFLSRLNAGTTAMQFRLPTEAEWEYACRAGTSTPYGTGALLTTAQANIDSRFAVDVDRRRGVREDAAGRHVPAERVGPARHARQRVGVDQRPVRPLQPEAGHRPARRRDRRDARHPRRQLALRRQQRAVRPALHPCAPGLGLQPRVPRRRRTEGAAEATMTALFRAWFCAARHRAARSRAGWRAGRPRPRRRR
ncbi:MAG: formylglycine-generating enzyme family protein [Desulfobacterales bacterium]|nr:formylglycine-generating enzyme family protein [Desulfobacterales bacterium]